MFFVVAADAGGCVDWSLQMEKVFINFSIPVEYKKLD